MYHIVKQAKLTEPTAFMNPLCVLAIELGSKSILMQFSLVAEAVLWSAVIDVINLVFLPVPSKFASHIFFLAAHRVELFL